MPIAKTGKPKVRSTTDIKNEAEAAVAQFLSEHQAYADKGIKAAACRARKATQILTALMKEYRAVSIKETK